MAKWKDTTSYYRGDKERIPQAFEATFGVFQIKLFLVALRYGKKSG